MVKSFQRAVRAASVMFLAPALVLGTGCATKGFVKSQTASANHYTDSLVTDTRGDLQTDIDQAQTRADAAMEKATLAEQLASGALDFDEIAAYQVGFAFDDYELDEAAMGELDALGGRLSSYPRYVLEVRGYADATGADRYNYRLGRERAESVQRYLMTRYSVPAARVALVSFGEDEPAAENSSRDGRAQNRRVQVRLLDMKPKGGKPLASNA